MQYKNSDSDSATPNLWSSYKKLSPTRKFIVTVFAIWLIQALPKWTAAVTADSEMSAQIMKLFITPGSESISMISEDQQGSYRL